MSKAAARWNQSAVDDPSADAAGPEGDADPVPDAHLVHERDGDQVVERLVDGGLVREDAHDLPAGYPGL